MFFRKPAFLVFSSLVLLCICSACNSVPTMPMEELPGSRAVGWRFILDRSGGRFC